VLQVQEQKKNDVTDTPLQTSAWNVWEDLCNVEYTWYI